MIKLSYRTHYGDISSGWRDISHEAGETMCEGVRIEYAYAAPVVTTDETALLSLLYDIRVAAGDKAGKLMQDELVERIRLTHDAGQAVVDRWGTPLWKEAEPTATVIYALRDALGYRGE